MNMKKTSDSHEQKRKYIEERVVQISKKEGNACGDYWVSERTLEYTTFILCDGMGSGIKANIAAVLCASRLSHLLNFGISLHEACENVINTMHKARTEDVPFSAFTIVRILNNGHYTCLTYEMPSPVLVEKSYAYVLKERFFTISNDVVGETVGVLKEGDYIIIGSDGVSQAGMGNGYSFGWKMDGFCSFVNRNIMRGASMEEILKLALNEVWKLSGGKYGDDVSIIALGCRKAKNLNILTGPPAEKSYDQEFVDKFMNADGLKIVCGSSTAEMVSRCIKKPVKNMSFSTSYLQPPTYNIEGIDFVTEGAITLNQIYNILDENIDNTEEDSSVSEICGVIKSADTIRFFAGEALNPGHNSITFKQMGIIPRNRIITLIAEKLKSMGKLVVIEKK